MASPTATGEICEKRRRRFGDGDAAAADDDDISRTRVKRGVRCDVTGAGTGRQRGGGGRNSFRRTENANHTKGAVGAADPDISFIYNVNLHKRASKKK